MVGVVKAFVGVCNHGQAVRVDNLYLSMMRYPDKDNLRYRQVSNNA